MSQNTELPRRVEEWTREHVRDWLAEVIKVDRNYADILYEQEVSGKELICYQLKYLQGLGIKHGPALRIIAALNKLKHYEYKPEVMHGTTVKTKDQESTSNQKSKKSKGKALTKSEYGQDSSLEQPTNSIQDRQDSGVDNVTESNILAEDSQPKEPLICESSNQIEQKKSADPKAQADDEEKKCTALRPSCTLSPFDQSSASHRYFENYTLPPETGPGNLINPVHEYKFMGKAEDIHVMKKKFNKEVFRFAAGCMNSRTNGTIHFGVADSKNSKFAHAEIIGVSVEEKDIIIDHFNQGINFHFKDHTNEAKACIRQPRFVEVLCPNSILSGKYVIEVDVVPSHSVVQGKLFYIQTQNEDDKKNSKIYSLFIREGAATHDIFKTDNPTHIRDILVISTRLNDLDNKRKEAETRPENKRTSIQGEKLKNLLTCGGNTIGHYNYYIIVTNKSHSEQLQHLQFMTTLKLFCVLDFDPNSAVSGSCHNYREVRIANLHRPSQFFGDPATVANTLNLYKQTSWVFCNGREDLDTETDRPLRLSEWLTSKAGEVQDMISFLCNPNTLPRGRFLVIFLLLSTVEAMNDPIFDTFMSFYKILGGTENLFSICTSETSFQKWRDFIQARCEHDISLRSIYNLELSEINGTILKLGQSKSNAQRLLPSAEESLVVLQQKDTDIMTSLEVLCENECENIFDESSSEFEEFKIRTETEFYRGGKVKWWNFYFSEHTFIKREKYKTLKKMIRSKSNDHTSPCVMVNLFHQPGCGGTTMAMHVMWNLRKEIRCAVLKDNTVSKEDLAQHVAHLIKCGKKEKSFQTPVLLLVEDLDETKFTQLQESGAFVIILNCIRTKIPEDRCKKSVTDSVFIKATLTEKEIKAFKIKLKELEDMKSYTTDNFHGFMIMKSNFNREYVADVVSNILKDFKVENKRDQLFCILALLNLYVAEPAISNSLCADFLGIELSGRESVLEKMEPYSGLLMEFEVEQYDGLKAICFVHRYLATECVKQLEETHKCSRADIVLNILHCELLFKNFAVMNFSVRLLESMKMTPQNIAEGHEDPFTLSPLIEEIKARDGPNKTEEICCAALKNFFKFAVGHLYLTKIFAQDKM